MLNKVKPATSCRLPGDPGAVSAPQSEAARQIRAIHALKTRLKWSDDDYRSLLRTLTGKTSSKACTSAERRQVREHMQDLAERAGLTAPRRLSATEFERRRSAASPQERKVWALWHQLHRDGVVRDPSARALSAFVKRQTGQDLLSSLNGAQLSTVIDALDDWRVREVVRRRVAQAAEAR